MPHHEEDEDNFTALAEEHEFNALLFDMDGTIIDSTDAVIKYWHQQGRNIGVDGDEILRMAHGRRSMDVLGILAPDRANWEYVKRAEGQIPVVWGKDAVEIPGSKALLADLEAVGAPWAIVTSGTTNLVNGWLDLMKIRPPKCMVTAEDVAKGKPDPACYQLGAKRLGYGDHRDASRIVVLEDSPAGIVAGKMAGFRVIALATTHTTRQLQEVGPDWIVRDLRSVSMLRFDSGSKRVTVRVRNAVVR